MPGLMSVAEFVAETREDYNSPTTSSFVTKIPLCRQTVSSLEEVRLKTVGKFKYLFRNKPLFYVRNTALLHCGSNRILIRSCHCL